MLIEFSIANFRSFKEEQLISFETDDSTKHPDNYFDTGKDQLRLLKSCVIYGANASGKTNVIRALNGIFQFIVNATDLKPGEAIRWYSPHQFDVDSRNNDSVFRLLFLLDEIRYEYQVSFNRHVISYESLYYYPKGQKALLFERHSNNPDNTEAHIKLGTGFRNKRIERHILPNHLFFTRTALFGHQQMLEIFRYFDHVLVWNSHSAQQRELYQRTISEWLSAPEEEHFRDKLNQLIRVADTKIDSISVKKLDEQNFNLPEGIPQSSKNRLLEQNRFITTANHTIYDRGKAAGTEPMDLREESEGTRVLFILGSLIIRKLEQGGVLLVDELENSLHPRLCKFLVSLFHNPLTNPLNAQLLFSTHEISLLDKNMFRKDQVWLTEKDKFGQSSLYSLSDFEDLDEDSAFDRFYMDGKLGAQPFIREIEFIFGNKKPPTH